MVPHGCYSVLQVPILLCRLASSVDAISCDAPGLTMKNHGHPPKVVSMETFQVTDRISVTHCQQLYGTLHPS